MISRVEKNTQKILKKRLRNKYKSPNVIKARGIFSPNSSENTGLIFNPIIRNLSEINEIVYVVLIRKTINIPKTLKIENSTKYKIKSTNSECDNIENYYIIKELNEDTKKFIKDLIRKHQDKKKKINFSSIFFVQELFK